MFVLHALPVHSLPERMFIKFSDYSRGHLEGEQGTAWFWTVGTISHAIGTRVEK